MLGSTAIRRLPRRYNLTRPDRRTSPFRESRPFPRESALTFSRRWVRRSIARVHPSFAVANGRTAARRTTPEGENPPREIENWPAAEWKRTNAAATRPRPAWARQNDHVKQRKDKLFRHLDGQCFRKAITKPPARLGHGCEHRSSHLNKILPTVSMTSSLEGAD